MKKQIKKNINQRFQYRKLEKKQIIQRSLNTNTLLLKSIRWSVPNFFCSLENKMFVSRIKNRCILTGRSRGIYRKFRLSRLQLKLFASKGLLPSFVKKSW